MRQPESLYNLKDKRVWVAGHRGMVGQALVERLSRAACEILVSDRQSVDLRRQSQVEDWMKAHRPHAVFLAAAKVGGILANDSYPADFIHDNLAIELNVIEAARENGVEKLLFLGSSCIYPKHAPQPMDEEILLTGELEPTNQWYAIAKIAGIKLCQAYRRQHDCDFIAAMPTNLYGPHDNFDLETSHVLPALIRRIHEAKSQGADHVTIWGSGSPRREFLFVEDCADALVHLMRHYSGERIVNVGVGEDLSIAELATTIADIVGYRGRFEFDRSKPDGTPRKLLDVSRLRGLGWRPKTSLEDGIARTYDWFRETHAAHVG